MPGSGALGTPWRVQIIGRLHILLRKELLCGRDVLECGERSYWQNDVNRLEVDVLNSAWKLKNSKIAVSANQICRVETASTCTARISGNKVATIEHILPFKHNEDKIRQ